MLLSLMYYVSLLPPLALASRSSIIILDRMYISYVDKNHIDAYMGTKFVNRTQKMIFGNGTLFTPLSKEDTYLTFQAYKFSRNQYRPTVIQIKQNLYYAITNFDFFGAQEMVRNHLKPYPDWPLKINVVNVTYYIRDWLLKLDEMPPLIPPGDYKSECTIFLKKNKKIVTVTGFYKIEEPLV